jgi:hypothetical protein
MTDFERLAQRRRRIIIGVAMATLVAMVAALTAALASKHSGSKGSKTATAVGVVSLASTSAYEATGSSAGSLCRGAGIYTDVSTGGLVTITDDLGHVLATTTLQQGTVDENGYCEFTFTAANVPTDRGPYGVQVTRRAVTMVDASQLFTRVVLTLANS